VNDAPGVSADRELSEPEERELWSHYGREYSARTAAFRQRTARAPGPRPVTMR
jgi:hypothetical protein